MIKRTVLFIVVFTLFFSALLAHPVERVNNWAKKQTENFDANDVVTLLNSNKNNGITCGPETAFNPATSYNISATTLDATHFVVTYMDVGNSQFGTAIVGTVSGSTISYGSEYVFNDAPTAPCSATALDATHFVVAYCDGGNDYRGTAVVGTVTGSDISWAYESVFNSAGALYCSATALDATHFVVAYRDEGNNSYGTAIVGTISEPITYIEYGYECVFNPGVTSYCSTTTLDATHFVAAYSDQDNSSYGTAIVGVVSGTGNEATISYGTENAFNFETTIDNSTTTLDATHFVAAYCNYFGPKWGIAIVGTVTDTNISYGTEYVFNSAATTYCSATALDATHFVVTYNDGGNLIHGSVVVGAVSDSDISYGSVYKFSVNSGFNAATTLDATHCVVAYSNASYGNSVLGEIGGEVTVTGTSIAPYETSPGATGVGMLQLSFHTDMGTATWTDVQVDLTGTANDEDISSVEIWKDDGNGTWDGLDSKEDTQIGSGTFSWNTATIDIIDQDISTIPWDFFIVYDIAAEADTSHTVGAGLEDESYITVISPATVSPFSNIESNYTLLPVTPMPEPESYGLLQNNPNPFKESTRISFNLKRVSKVEVNIYNLKGQLVESLYSGIATSKNLDWNCIDENGEKLQSGMYFYSLFVNGELTETKRLILMK